MWMGNINTKSKFIISQACQRQQSTTAAVRTQPQTLVSALHCLTEGAVRAGRQGWGRKNTKWASSIFCHKQETVQSLTWPHPWEENYAERTTAKLRKKHDDCLFLVKTHWIHKIPWVHSDPQKRERTKKLTATNQSCTQEKEHPYHLCQDQKHKLEVLL